MSLPEFAADIVATGTVLGADTSHAPDQVTDVLGRDCAESRRRGLLWRDWGLVEFFWQRNAAARPWRGTHFSVQLHRLAAGVLAVEPAISQRYGAFGSCLLITDLWEALSDRGIDLVEIPASGPGVQEYWQPDSHVVVLADQNRQPPGTVLKISAPVDAQAVAVRQHRGKARPMRQALDHLLVAQEPERLRWLARREPDEPDRTSWWLHLLVVIEYRIEGDPQHEGWIRLHLWAVEQAHVRGALSGSETAIRTAYFVNEQHERQGVNEHILALLPSAEEVVQDCLAALPISYGQAQEPIELSTRNIDTMRDARRAKNLISAAALHQGRLCDPQLSAQLSRWIDLGPNLV